MKPLQYLIGLLEHHPEHYLEINISGHTYRPCSRCTGQYLFGIPATLLFMYLYFTQMFVFSFTTVFIVSWVLALSTIMDWASVELLHIRKGSNVTRFITGGCLGIGMSMYIWLLPTNWSIKLISMAFYGIVVSLLVFSARCKKYDIDPFEQLSLLRNNFYEIIANPKQLFCCNCCCPCCATGGSSGCIMPLCALSCCCCPCLCCPLMGGSGGCSSCDMGKMMSCTGGKKK